ncbi:30S ribosome-binding factor RbfA [Spiroplasma endosymbiont of Asaphidion curtum]|uniref:30S ribosome-binding factor RbfA n=1 Tax=Spiroplasma endosymbiont of Asaphidion curtum TaxID=3066281 RepID=UPI00313C7026
MANIKFQRLQTTIQRLLTNILQKEVKDEVLQKLIITEVKLNNDCTIAKVYYDSLVFQEQKQIIELAIKQNLWLIRKKLGQQLTIYKVPQLFFVYDQSLSESRKIEDILNKIKKDSSNS